MKKANSKAFSNLADQLFNFANISTEEAIRYISTNERDKKWLIETQIVENLNILPNVKALIFEFEDCKYLAFIGVKMQNHVYESTVIEEYELNAGLLTVLISENFLNLNPTINFLEFEDNIMFQHKDEDYKGHDFYDLQIFLEPIQLFKIHENSLIKDENIYRILAYMYSNNSHNLILKFNTDILEFISEIALVGSRFISYNLMLYSLLSTNYKHSFLELYRLVERLFPLNYLKKFYEKSLTELTFLDFSTELENTTGWRPREDEAIQKIFSSFKINTKDAFDDFFNSINLPEGDYKYFYKLRNSIVHFRANHEEFDLDDEQWNHLILATLTLIDEQYSFYNDILK